MQKKRKNSVSLDADKSTDVVLPALKRQKHVTDKENVDPSNEIGKLMFIT